MVDAASQRAEFSRLVTVEKLGDEPLDRVIEATAEEREALARRFGLRAIGRLQAELSLQRPRGGPLIKITGRFDAEVEQTCVVTLELVASRIEAAVNLLFTLDPALAGDDHEVLVSPEEEDPPEPIGSGGLDLGEAVAQQLAVSLDPYPRAPGAALERSQWGREGNDGPFAVLADLKRKH